MVVSLNPEPNKEVFQTLLNNTLSILDSESKSDPQKYLSLLGTKLEDVVAEIMVDKAKGTAFENSIELISGQRFPDIIAKKYYGIEVKTTKQNHWTTTGNSVLEGTRVDGIEKIYMLFGKMISPIEFKYRPYEECLSDVVVTHSPRYFINMDLPKGQTIFDKLDIPYDILRNEVNPVKPIIEYYRKLLKPGEELWWLEQEEQKPASLIIKSWNNLNPNSKKEYVIMAMSLFPEIFSNRKDKFNRIAVWLVNMESVVCPNIRDNFTAGGKGLVIWEDRVFSQIPQIIIKLNESLGEIKEILNNTEKEILANYWECHVDDKYLNWIDLIVENTRHMGLPFDLRDFLIEKM